MKKPSQHLITEVPRKRGQVELTIGIDLGDVWSRYCTLNQQGEVIDRGRFRTTTPKGSTRGSPMCLMLALLWRLVFIRSGSASSLNNWAMR